jgi:hypothetical protein
MFRFLNTLLPSSKIKQDINFTYNMPIDKVSSIKAINISQLSLISPIKKTILNHRKKQKVLNIEKNFKKMSLIIPYRHREDHLKEFLPYIKKYLLEQKIDFEIIVAQ